MPQYSIGIDLGTTNSVLAFARLGEDHAKVEIVPIPQLVAAGTLEARNMLPSFLYLGTEQEKSGGTLDVPREAAVLAGLPDDLVLLEEPQAALYAWLTDMGDRWRKQLKIGDTLLVCDVGGGTTDLTLIGVTEENGELSLRRIAVGNHTLVGGDNMDLALAHFATTAFKQKGVELNPWQSVSLWHACRAAKETLLAEKGPKKHPVAVLGRGSKPVGGTGSADLEGDEVRKRLADGFSPGGMVS